MYWHEGKVSVRKTKQKNHKNLVNQQFMGVLLTFHNGGSILSTYLLLT